MVGLADFGDFGLIDLLYLLKRQLGHYNYPQFNPVNYYTNIHNNINNPDEGKNIWFYFVPHAIEEHEILKKNYFSGNRNIYRYETDSTYLIKSDPSETASLLEEMCQDASENIERKLKEGHDINILGVSLGNAIAIKMAATYPCKNLVSVVGGARLWECITDSLFTWNLVKRSNFSKENYKNCLKEFNAIDYVENINSDNILLFLGGFDKVVRYSHGKKLAEEFKSKFRNIEVKTYKLWGHCATMYLAGRDLASTLFNDKPDILAKKSTF